MKTVPTLASAAFLSLVLSGSAHAAARAWVSSTGTDSGTCLVATPCRSFQYAHDQLDAGGEIDVKDPAGYGSLTINKSISVVADGVVATIGAPKGGYAVVVNNTKASDVVVLRGLTINGTDVGSGGGFFIGTGKVTVDHCFVKGTLYGIKAITANASVTITNNLITGNDTGIVTDSTAFTGVGGNVIVNNRVGISYQGNSAFSYGDNKINGNSSSDFVPGPLPVDSMR